MKQCKSCPETDERNFYKNSKGGLQSECKACMKVRAKASYCPEVRAQRQEIDWYEWQSWNVSQVDPNWGASIGAGCYRRFPL